MQCITSRNHDVSSRVVNVAVSYVQVKYNTIPLVYLTFHPVILRSQINYLPLVSNVVSNVVNDPGIVGRGSLR